MRPPVCDTVEQSRSLYLISYVGNGGKNIPANQIKTQGVNITLSSTTPTREGYIFKGWGTSTGSDVLYQPGDVYTANARVKLSAVWEPKQFTVKYNLKGGKESGNAAFAEKTYVYGTTRPAMTSRAGTPRRRHPRSDTIPAMTIPNTPT